MLNSYTYEIHRANNGVCLHLVYVESVYRHGYAIFNNAPDAIAHIKETKEQHSFYGVDLVYDPALNTSGNVLTAYKEQGKHFSKVATRQIFLAADFHTVKFA